ncbi:MAG: 4-hydroxy-tetrahydrodipicolinate synthase [Holosporales bacterium]|jgi:4-hydroxy-tetrahydrodipicolinate synthase|nr:4-hydroxy-tetrahydrodipicolinate synthase [Holosporales bacterium]
MFRGYFAAIVTPWKNDKLDLKAFGRHIDFLLENKINGIVACGSTGESILLSPEERQLEIKEAIARVNGQVPVVINIGSPDTRACIRQAQEVEKYGPNAMLITCPYYVKPSQEGIYNHFKAIHDATHLPIVIYNVPSRTGTDIATDIIKRMVDNLSRVKALKEATSNLCRITELAKAYPLERFQVLCGNDDIALAAFAMGACGAISVTANIAPKECVDMYERFFAGNLASAAATRNKLAHLNQALFVEPNPVPVKYSLSLMGRMSDEVRGSLAQLSQESKAEVKAAMCEAGLLCKRK